MSRTGRHTVVCDVQVINHSFHLVYLNTGNLPNAYNSDDPYASCAQADNVVKLKQSSGPTPRLEDLEASDDLVESTGIVRILSALQ